MVKEILWLNIKEAYSLFENLLMKIKSELVTILLNITLIDEKNSRVENEKKINEKFKEIATKKIGRNEPCSCGSGKKYKHCCGGL